MGKPAAMEKRKGAGPFKPKWLSVQGRHKALKSSSFQPSIMSAIDTYDGTLKQYDGLVAEQEKLKTIICDLLKQNQEAFNQIQGLTGEITDITKKSSEAMKKSGGKLQSYADGKGADPDGVPDDLADLVNAAEQFVENRKSRWDKIDKIANDNLARFRKALAEFTKQHKEIKSKIDKLDQDAYKAQVEIGNVVGKYVQIADEMDHPEIIKSLQSLGKEFGQ